MSTKKIKDFTLDKICKICKYPEHNPPGFQVFTPGMYEHTCPGCGAITNFTVPLITF